MIENFRDSWVEDIFHGISTKASRQGLPLPYHASAQFKLQLIHNAGSINDLRLPPGNRLERLQGNRSDEHSIRISGQWRIVFRHYDPAKFKDVGIEDYH